MPVKAVKDPYPDTYEVIPVKVLNDQGKTALVEWAENGGKELKRGFIPSKYLEAGGVVRRLILESATPYGLPWAKLIQLKATPEGMEIALHRAGIWTLDDLMKNPMPALGAIQAAYWLDMSILLMAAVNYEKGVK